MRRLLSSFLWWCAVFRFLHQFRASPMAAPVSDRNLGKCPLNVSQLSSHPWIVKKCKEGTHCCEAIDDLMRILLFPWMHQTDFFLLPDVHKSKACMDAIQRHMESQGITENVFEGCKMKPEDFVTSPRHCHGIQNRSTFEKIVNTSKIKRSCDGSRSQFRCHECIGAMAEGLRHLTEKDRKNNCEFFFILYVGGYINADENMGPAAAYCIMSAQNLKDLDALSTRKTKVGISIGILFLAAAVVVAISVCVRRPKNLWKGGGFERMVLRRRESQLFRESVKLTNGLLFYRFSEIKEFTANFSPTNIIGQGGFGTVFRGTLPDGSQIAVKRFNDSTTKGDEDFKHEVHVISSVKHRNLLPLKGYSIGKSDRQQHFLVYDYMPNGSLADYFFRSGRPVLTWPQRHKIAVGIARGLAYLHGDAKPAIIHRDVKAANVLLDADLNALVADFGLARFKLEDCNKTHYTTRAVGTLGYVAPEYALYGHLTDKSDVYSFGIVLLELMSGRRALDLTDCDNSILSDWADELVGKGRVEEVVDERIREEGEGKESMEKMVLVGLRCVNRKAACRPCIQQVLPVLESINGRHSLPWSSLSSSGSSRKGKDKKRHCKEGEDVCYPSGSVELSTISVDSYQVGR